MGNVHQDKWVDQLPWTLLSRRVALHQDVGASPSELVFGKTPTIPGVIAKQGLDLKAPELRDLLTNLQKKSAAPAVQTSTHSPPPVAPDAALPPGTTHVFTKNHKTLGLDPSWSGPFPILESISRSQIRIKIGLTKDGNVRSEVRRLHDVKPAFMDESTPVAERPNRGRKPLQRPSAPTYADITKTNSSEPALKVNKATPPNSNGLNVSNGFHSNNPTPASTQTGETKVDKWNTARNTPRTSRNPNPKYIDSVVVAA